MRSPTNPQAPRLSFLAYCFFSLLLLPVTAQAADPASDAGGEEWIKLTILRVERTKTLTLPTQGTARVLILDPEIVELTSVSEGRVVFTGNRIGSSIVHVWDPSGRQSLRVDVTELASILREIEEGRQAFLQKKLGFPQRTLKIQYRGNQQALERSPRASLSDLKEQNRIRTHQFKATSGIPWGKQLVGDLYLEQRRDILLGKEAAQPRHISLEAQELPIGLLGKVDAVAGDKDLTLSHLTVDGKRYRGLGLFPSLTPPGQKRQEKLALSLFGGQEREGFFLDLPAGSQTRQARSHFAGTRLEYALLENTNVHVTDLHRYGKNSESRADNVYEAGLNWALKNDKLRLETIGARNGPESGHEVTTEASPLDWIHFKNEFWRIGKEYETVTGPINRRGQTGLRNTLQLVPPVWEDALTLKSEAKLYRDRSALNPVNPRAWNTYYSLGLDTRLPRHTALQTAASYEDQSGSPLPYVSKQLDLNLSQDIFYEETPWFQELLYHKQWIQSITPFAGVRYAHYDKSNHVPGFDATLKLFRVGTRANFLGGFWGSLSWSQGQLKEANPQSFPERIRPKELIIEAGKSHRFKTVPVDLGVTMRYDDVQNTFQKTHQPFPDQNQISGSLRIAWQLPKDRELFGNLTATRQKAERAGGDTVLDLLSQFGIRTAWDTQWAFTRTGSIAGSLFQDLNYNGIRDPNEPGIPGARVEVEGGPSGVTDQNGDFLLRSVQEGVRAVKIEPDQIPTGYFFTTSNVVEQLAIHDQEPRVDFGIATQVEFHGRVYNDIDENRLFDQGRDVPIQGVTLTVETGQSAASGPDGVYRIGKLPPGDHAISVLVTSIPDGYQSLVPIRKTAQTHGGDILEYEVPLKALRTIFGSVFVDTNGNGLREESEKGAEGLHLTIGRQEITTGPQGLYRLENLPPGPQSLRVDPETVPSGYVVRSPESVGLTIPNDPYLEQRDFALVPLDWKPPVTPAIEAEISAAAPSAPAAESESQRAQQRLRQQIKTLLGGLTPKEFTYQIIDDHLTNQFPELSVLAELHPGIWIDYSRKPADTAELVMKLISHSADRVNYYGSSERSLWFKNLAQTAFIETEISSEVRLQVLLQQILSGLSGLSEEELSTRIDLERLDGSLAQIIAKEKQ